MTIIKRFGQMFRFGEIVDISDKLIHYCTDGKNE